MPWGAIIAGVVGGISGASSSHAKTKKRRASRRRLKLHLDRAQSQVSAGFGQATKQLVEAKNTVKQGTTNALAEATKIGASSRRRIQDDQVAQQGRLSQSLQRRGLFNSTVYDNLKRGIRDDTQRSFIDLDSRLAELRTGIIQRGAASEANALAQLAQFYTTRGEELAGKDLSLASYYGGQNFTSQGSNAGGIGSLLSGLFSQFGDE